MPLTRTGKWAVIYGVVAIEVVTLTSSYYVWNRLNMSQGEGRGHGPSQAHHVMSYLASYVGVY